MAEVQTQPVYPRGITFEQVWAALMEDRDQIKKSRDEFDRQMKESREREKESKEEFDREMKERRAEFDSQMKEAARERLESQKVTDRHMQETDRYLKEIGKRLGDFTNSFGDVVQHMIAPNLLEKFQEMGFEFEEASNKVKIRNKKHDIRFEIDVYLQNGDVAMLVEIKSDLTISDINKHIQRLEKMRKHADLRGDKRRFLGAVAGIVVEDAEREYALSQGFYLIEPSGENFNITPPHGEPKEW